jgi:transcriptional regulator with XRE-family HTH domain
MSITGERLKEQRKKLEMNADDIAAELGVSRSTVFRYENGYIEKVPVSILEKLAVILHTTPAYLMGWTDDSQDWEQIGNDEGIYPPNDYKGKYEDFVKAKLYQESDDLIDSFYDTYYRAIAYLKSFDCKICEVPNSEKINVITPAGEHLSADMNDLVNNFMIYGSSRPGIKKLLTPRELIGLTDNERSILSKYRSIDEKGKHTVDTILKMEYERCNNDAELLNAAHADNNATEEEQQHDNDIMNDDEFWK